MAMPQLLSRKTGGIVAPSANPQPDDHSKSSKAKTPQEGIKMIVRRLPPGLTEAEFLSVLGREWKPGNGRIGWFDYHMGQVSTFSKPSRPATAYLHLLSQEDVDTLAEVVPKTPVIMKKKDESTAAKDANIVTPPAKSRPAKSASTTVVTGSAAPSGILKQAAQKKGSPPATPAPGATRAFVNPIAIASASVQVLELPKQARRKL
ncbi:hypothetical protein P8C59_006267 [Phyllachora maydis]|uniref:UPF3 domain-containing protein n=1 Tax=Phyllachora maydis TaxID=1825666 RepID=A0AAD9I6J0_9PEZI|nr:hypothetical protein P8C59_006267 [Phyllachora maydis]